MRRINVVNSDKYENFSCEFSHIEPSGIHSKNEFNNLLTKLSFLSKIILMLFICMGSQLSGQDFCRKGFHFSLGGAPALSSYKIDGSINNPTGNTIYYDGNPVLHIATNPYPKAKMYPYSSSKLSLNTNFNIGYGFTEKIIVSYMNRVSFVFDDVIHRVDYAEPYSLVLGVIGITGIECSYFFSNEIKSFYTSIGGGLSVSRQPFATSYMNQLGWGLSFAGGYQFNKHFAAELNLMIINASILGGIEKEIENLGSGIDIEEKVNAYSISFGIKYLLF